MTDVFVIAPIRVYREMLSRVLDNFEDLRAVGTEPTVAEALPRLRELRPDVALVDASVPDVGLVPPPTAEPEVKFVALGVPETDAVAWVEAGVSGYVSEGASFEDLELAVKRVAGGQLVTSPEVSGRLLDRIRRLSVEASDAAARGRLTPREREVLDLVGEGISNKLIARRLSIQEQTVKNHIHSILLKLGVDSRAEAVAQMRRGGLSDR